MAGPRKLWKTEITVWSEFDPQKIEASALVREAEQGDAIITKCEAHHVASPYVQDDGPPESFFDPGLES